MRRNSAVSLALIAAASLSTQVACSVEPDEPVPTSTPVVELEPGEYRSRSLTSTSDIEVTDPGDALGMTITRDGAYRLTIRDGCNAHSGPFHLNDGVVTITRFSSTLSGCVPPLNAVDEWVDEIFADPLTVTRSGSELTWKNLHGEMVFVEVP